MMRRLRWMILCLTTMVVATNLSCSREMYDQEITQQINDSLSPVQVDGSHDWQLATTTVLTVHTPAGTDAQWLQILTADPSEDQDAEVAIQVPVSAGEVKYIGLTYPKRLSTLYAALVDGSGRYTVTAIDPASGTNVRFTTPLYSNTSLSYTPQPQTFVYAFEEELPDVVNVDYDYNDVVLHIAHERTGEREVRFHVKLAAVGGKKQIGACLHLKNFKYDEIESVTTVDNASFNQNHGNLPPDQMLVTHKNKKDLLLKSFEDEAVINMFVDAHWATGDALTESYGQIPRKLYNVTRSSGNNAVNMTPREVTYIVTFKESAGLDYLNFDQLDPFIIEEYNGGIYEVHSFVNRNSPVLYSYRIPDIIKLPWSLVIPYSKFRHPLDGVNIGFKRADIVSFGAYGFTGHSFGEWASNRNSSATDWYLNDYVTQNQVF